MPKLNFSLFLYLKLIQAQIFHYFQVYCKNVLISRLFQLGLMKVCVIDDSRLSVSALQNIVSKLGHEVIGTAFDGEKGAEVVKEKRPDVVLLDFVMPNKDGLETAKLIRASVPSTKIVMVTQKELDGATKNEINASAYVLKPITADKIKAVLDKM